MKHFFLSVIGIFMFSVSLFAQVSYHVNIGGQNSNWRGSGMQILDNITDISKDYLKQGAYTSFYAGASASIPIAEKCSIEPGLQYSQTGTTLTGNLSFKLLSLIGIRASARAISHRIEVPVLFKAEVAKGLYIVAGPQINYSYNNKLQLKAGALGFNAINQKIDIDNLYEPFSGAALGGLQYQFAGGMRVQALYEYGLTKTIRNGTMDIRQNNIKIGVGIPLNFLSRSNEAY